MIVIVGAEPVVKSQVPVEIVVTEEDLAPVKPVEPEMVAAAIQTLDIPLENSVLIPIINNDTIDLIETLEEKLPEVPKSRPIVVGELSEPVSFDVIEIPVLSALGSSTPLINDLVDVAVDIIFTTKAVTGTTSSTSIGSRRKTNNFRGNLLFKESHNNTEIPT